MATALGEEIPEKLRADAGPYYQRAWALSPAVPLALRATGAQRAAREGLLSSAAMVDLYSQIYTLDNPETPEGVVAVLLRRAYRAADPAVRVQAMREQPLLSVVHRHSGLITGGLDPQHFHGLHPSDSMRHFNPHTRPHTTLCSHAALAMARPVVYIGDLSAHQTPKEVRNARYPPQGKRAV